MTTSWDQKRKQINRLLKELQRKPANEMLGHWRTPESILNAYREGDLLFPDALQELKEWAIEYAQKQGAA